MGLPKVKKFLCCISLETGGLLIGWFNIILSFLVLFGMVTLLSLAVVGYNHGDFNNNNNVIGAFAALVFVYAIFILYYLIVFVAALNLIRGVGRVSILELCKD